MKTRHSERFENDPTPSRSLIEKYREAVGQDDDDDCLALVSYRGGREEYEIGLEYCLSSDPLDRATGADVLSQLGWQDQTFLEETVDVLIPMLKDPDDHVASCAATALGLRDHPRATPYLIEISEHRSPLVRRGVVFGLLGVDDPQAICTLIHLSRDSDADARNWALFGLGSQIGTDTPEIRSALFDGLDDPFDEARGEALVGLAVRGDARVVDAILKEWEGDTISILSVEAAEEVGDPRLHPLMKQFLDTMDLENDSFYREQLESSIAACRPKPNSSHMHKDNTFQDASFEVRDVVGSTVEAFSFFAEDRVHPEMILVKFDGAEWRKAFFDAFIVFWDVLTVKEMEEACDDFDGTPSVDLSEQLSLAGALVRRVFCQCGEGGTVLTFEFDLGLLRFGEVDSSDPSTDIYWSWQESPA